MWKSEYEKLLEYFDNQKTSSTQKEEITIEKVKDLPKDIPKSVSSRVSNGFNVDRFYQLLKKSLRDEYINLQNYERPLISVTELLTCLRKNFYYRQKYKVNVDELFNFAYLKLIQEVSNSIHFVAQKYYNFDETEKTITSKKYNVKGKVDAIKEGYVIEIKTVETEKFSGEYKEKDYQQSLVYAYILKNEYQYNVHTITLVYFFRDNLKKKPVAFDLPFNDSLAKTLLEKALILKNCLDKNIVPGKISSTEEQCKYCEFKKYCQKDDKEEKQEKSVFLL